MQLKVNFNYNETVFYVKLEASSVYIFVSWIEDKIKNILVNPWRANITVIYIFMSLRALKGRGNLFFIGWDCFVTSLLARTLE